MDNVIVIMFIGIIIVGVVLVGLMGVGKGSKKLLDKQQYQRDWLAIQRQVSADSASQQFAILQADKLLDKALRESGYSGATMGERMTSASRVFSRREAVWAAHKLRNRIAHEPSVAINPQWTRKALASFKRALRDVGAI